MANTEFYITREQAKELDRRAIQDYEIPGVVLMENAGAGAARFIQSFIIHSYSRQIPIADNTLQPAMSDLATSNQKVLIVCGKGNNGGDGFVIARHLHNQNIPVQVFLIGKKEQIDPLSEAGINLKILQHTSIPFQEIHDPQEFQNLLTGFPQQTILVDAIFGTGLAGAVKEPYFSIIQTIAKANMNVIAIDIPSGLDSNTGCVLGIALPAKITITFGLPKQGFIRGEGCQYTGLVYVIDIGFPKELIFELAKTSYL